MDIASDGCDFSVGTDLLEPGGFRAMVYIFAAEYAAGRSFKLGG